MEKEIIICGQIGHGKTTLINDLANFTNSEIITDGNGGAFLDTGYVRFKTFDNHSRTLNILKSSHNDLAVLVVSAIAGAMPQTIEQLQLIKVAGIKDIVVFLNKCDVYTDKEILGYILEETKLYTDQIGYPNAVYVTGSAKNLENIDRLLQECNKI
jgi:selenocysteine-specific translation elongation factor